MTQFEIIFNNYINPVFSQPSLLLGGVTLIGLIALRKPFVDIVIGTIRTVIGVLLLQAGSGLMTTVFRPIIFSLSERFSFSGVIIDPYATLAAVTDSLGDKLGWVGVTMMLGFLINIILVALNKITKMHSLFLTGHVMFLQSALITWLVYYYFQLDFQWTVGIAGLLIGVYWTVGAQLNAKPTQIISGGAGFTVAHQQHLMNWIAWKVGPFIGDPEQSIDSIKFPEWLEEFKDVKVSVPIVMSIFFTPLLLLLGPERLKILADSDAWLLYIPIVALSFGAFMVIINLGISMFVKEISESFKGISLKLLPNAIIGVDGMAVAPYAPNAVVAGFVVCALGEITGILVLLLIKSPIFIIPGFIPVFFDAAITAVFADKFGGWRAVVVISFVVGLIHIFGSAWAAANSGLVGGWMGNSDWATIWPLVMAGMKAISPLH